MFRSVSLLARYLSTAKPQASAKAIISQEVAKIGVDVKHNPSYEGQSILIADSRLEKGLEKKNLVYWDTYPWRDPDKRWANQRWESLELPTPML